MTGGTFSQDTLLQAFDALGEAALAAGARLDIAVYGGSALMLASNFRYASEDADVSLVGEPWPEWLTEAATRIAERLGLAPDWLKDAVTFHLSPLAGLASDYLEFGSFPRGAGAVGLTGFVPTADYMLALKLKAMRITDPVKGEQESAGILNLMRVIGIDTPEAAIATLGRFFPRSASDAGKQRFLLKHLIELELGHHAPRYPQGSL